MSEADKRFLLVLQDMLHDMANMEPSNPCDTKAIFSRFPRIVRASREAYLAIADHGFGDKKQAMARLTQALDKMNNLPPKGDT